MYVFEVVDCTCSSESYYFVKQLGFKLFTLQRLQKKSAEVLAVTLKRIINNFLEFLLNLSFTLVVKNIL